MGKIFSPGKFLFTSEYVVLDGALAFAVPTKLGQEFFFEETEDGKSLISWNAFHRNNFWLNIEINYRNWKILGTNLPESAEFLLKVLKQVQKLSEIKFKGNNSYHLKTNLQFPPDFGLGSSSTLMNNFAQWAEIDPFLLNELCLGGSGYDIAVAKEKSEILYQNTENGRVFEKINFNPDFKNELIFIHLNEKQNSREGIMLYRSKNKSQNLIDQFSAITRDIVSCQNLENFSHLMNIHEQKLSDFLGIEKVKDKYFENCPAFVKSLGAWGGDFVMSRKFSGFQDYFSERGFSSVFLWNELID
jgi:mevalonate kinase